MSFQGRLVREDIGSGVWVLETDDGKRVTLYGDIPEQYANQRVQVEGDRASGMGIGMLGGETVEVRKIKKA